MPDPKSPLPRDLLSATTELSYKCPQCGNMFPTDQEEGTCDVCGFHCSADACQIIQVSDEDY